MASPFHILSNFADATGAAAQCPPAARLAAREVPWRRVEANDAKDTASRNQIRSHLGHIVTMFAAGDFSAPMLIHAQNPTGTEAMKRLRDAIQYRLKPLKKGHASALPQKTQTRSEPCTSSCVSRFLTTKPAIRPEVTKAQ